MPEGPRTERNTQRRVVSLFSDKSRPDYLGYDNQLAIGMRARTTAALRGTCSVRTCANAAI